MRGAPPFALFEGGDIEITLLSLSEWKEILEEENHVVALHTWSEKFSSRRADRRSVRCDVHAAVGAGPALRIAGIDETEFLAAATKRDYNCAILDGHDRVFGNSGG